MGEITYEGALKEFWPYIRLGEYVHLGKGSGFGLGKYRIENRGVAMDYRKPKRIFEDSGTVDSKISYHVELENVVNTKNQDIKTMVDTGRYFSIFAQRQTQIYNQSLG